MNKEQLIILQSLLKSKHTMLFIGVDKKYMNKVKTKIKNDKLKDKILKE